MTKLCAWRADNFCRPLTIAGEIGLCLRPDQMDRGPAYSLYGVQVPRGTKWTSLGVIPLEESGGTFTDIAGIGHRHYCRRGQDPYPGRSPSFRA
jgi:hypothetical protein